MPLRILDEGEFWKHQEAEHTEVIRALVPNLEEPFVQSLKEWEQVLSQTQALFVRYIEMVSRMDHVSPEVYQQIMNLVQYALSQSEQFIKLLDHLAASSPALKSNPTAITVLNHIRRESEYFVGIAQALLYQSNS